MFLANINTTAFTDSIALIIIIVIPALMLLILARTALPVTLTVFQFSRLQWSNTEKILERAERRYEQGNRSLKNLLMLSAGNAYLGRGVPAERYAREAHEEAERTRIAQKHDLNSRVLAALLRLATFDAKVAQGRFVEAAQELQPHIGDNIQSIFTTVLVAWGYFLGEDYDQVRQMIGPASFSRMKTSTSARYRFMLAYMVQYLYGTDMRQEMKRNQVKAWEKEIRLNTMNPYGVRTREILQDAVRKMG